MTRPEAKKITGLASGPQVGREKRLSVLSAGSFFISFTIYFYVLLYTFLPFVKLHTKFNPAVHWLLTGYALFVPLFVLPLILVRHEGGKSIPQIQAALCLKRLTGRDLKYSLMGLGIFIIATAGIFFRRHAPEPSGKCANAGNHTLVYGNEAFSWCGEMAAADMDAHVLF